jgi:hypothetical protein
VKKTTGGYRAAQFETITAADKGDYADKNLYAVEGLPGVWRRVKAPRVDPASVGLLSCWFDGGIIYLEHCVPVNDELRHAECPVENPEELAAFMDALHQKRESALAREMETAAAAQPAAPPEPAKPVSGQENAASTTTEDPAEKPPEV